MKTSALVLVCLTLWAAPGRAQSAVPKACDPLDPKKCSVGLQEGQAAPFSGQLLTPKLAIDLGQKAEGCDERMKLELARVTGLSVVQKELDLKLITIEKDAAKQKVDELQKALEKTKDLVPPPHWYERPQFVVVATVVVTVGVFVLAVKTVQWATPAK